MGKIIITKLHDKDILFLFDNDHEIVEIKCINDSMVDTVYMGRIDSIDENLDACYVTIAKGVNVFLELKEFKDIRPKCGDKIIVQIKADPIKTKQAVATLDICLPGSYCVCHLNGTGISASRKLERVDQQKLVDAVVSNNLQSLNDFKWVLRTNSVYLLEEGLAPLFEEMTLFSEIGAFLKDIASTRRVYSVLYKPQSMLISLLNDIASDSYDSIVTDNPSFYKDILASKCFKDKSVSLYEDEYITLKNLYSLETHLGRALDKKVYLNCGGNIIIEPTEALTVIDVNSGKASSKRNGKTYYFKVNKEAAIEIAKQLRIRNISGMIVVDFINMESENDQKKIMNTLSEELLKDKIYTRVIDMTALGLVEITRKKSNPPLYEMLRG